MRKQSYWMIMLLGIGLGMVACGSDEEPAPVKEGVNITMTFPDEWDDTNRFGDPVVLVGMSPPELGSDSFYENVNVVTEEMPGFTLTTYYDSMLTSLEGLQNFTLLSAKDTTLNGYATKKIIFTVESNQTTLQLMEYILYEKETGIIVTCTALERSFARYEAQFNQIVSTIRLE